jgi:hypothetical protein
MNSPIGDAPDGKHVAEGVSRPSISRRCITGASMPLYSLVYRAVGSLPLSAAIANPTRSRLHLPAPPSYNDFRRRLSSPLFLSLPLTASFLSMDYSGIR